MKLSQFSQRSAVCGLLLAGGLSVTGLVANGTSSRSVNAADAAPVRQLADRKDDARRGTDVERLRTVYHDLEKQRDVLRELGKSAEAADANRHRQAAAEHLTLAMQEIKLEIGEFNDDKPRDRK
ncbi:MAG: hypothetical protein JWM97_3213 [Phycisphaerales bacterium]|nr:hypothetical protein [Phycisphaerales bacterium]